MWSEKPSTHIQLSVNLLTLRCTGYNWVNYAFPFYWHNWNYIQAMVWLSRWTCNHTCINIPNAILGTLKKRKKNRSFCGCVCQAESHKSVLFIIYKNTSTIFRREGTASQEVADHVQIPNLTLKWFAEPTNMEVVLGSTDIGLVKVEPITLICVQKERMPVYLSIHQSIMLVLNPKP
jgi:hypothetical protein